MRPNAEAAIDGVAASIAPLADHHAAADTLGPFLRALHRPAAAYPPRNPWRGIPPAARTARHPANLLVADGALGSHTIDAALRS